MATAVDLPGVLDRPAAIEPSTPKHAWTGFAVAAAGPSWPALQHVGYDQFTHAVREALSPLYTEGLGVRIVSEFGWIIGQVPST